MNSFLTILIYLLQLKPLKELTFVRTNGKIINPIDLIQMKKKASSYKKFSELRGDISWYIHNCQIIHGGSQSIMNASRELFTFVEDEITSIIECPDCYANESFILPCKQIHPIVWAQSNGFEYWPAKAISFKNNLVHVRYFGDSSADDIPVDSYYQYSPQPPVKPESVGADLYETALDVC